MSNAIAVSLIHSRLDYCNSLLTGPKYQLKRLQSVQNSAAKVVTKSKKLDHIIPVLNDLHWLPIHKRIDYKLLSITQKCVISACPQYLSDLLNTYKPSRNLRSSNQALLCIPSVKDILFPDLKAYNMVKAVSDTNHLFCLINYLMN